LRAGSRLWDTTDGLLPYQLNFYRPQRRQLGDPLLDGEIEMRPGLPECPNDDGGSHHHQNVSPWARCRPDRDGPDLELGRLAGPKGLLYERQVLLPRMDALGPGHGLGPVGLEDITTVQLGGLALRLRMHP
jgi:hypothetical protein